MENHSLSFLPGWYSAINASIRELQRSPLQSPLPDPRRLFTSATETAPELITSIKRLRVIPLQMQIVSFRKSHCSFTFSGSTPHISTILNAFASSPGVLPSDSIIPARQIQEVYSRRQASSIVHKSVCDQYASLGFICCLQGMPQPHRYHNGCQ